MFFRKKKQEDITLTNNWRVSVETTEGTVLVKPEIYNKYKHDYFVGEDGIRYGHEEWSKMILPKEILVEAINKYMTN